MDKEAKKHDVECGRCRYRWSTKSQLLHVTCPNCRHNNNVEEAEKRFLESSKGSTLATSTQGA